MFPGPERLSEGVDFWHFTASAPFFYSILMQTASAGIPFALTLKIMTPILHGFLAPHHLLLRQQGFEAVSREKLVHRAFGNPIPCGPKDILGSA